MMTKLVASLWLENKPEDSELVCGLKDPFLSSSTIVHLSCSPVLLQLAVLFVARVLA